MIGGVLPWQVAQATWLKSPPKESLFHLSIARFAFCLEHCISLWL